MKYSGTITALIAIYLLTVVPANAVDGFLDTAKWWRHIESKKAEYQVLLANLPGASGHPEAGIKSEHFSRQLVADYPGSSFRIGAGGSLVLDETTRVDFDFEGKVTGLFQRIGHLSRYWNFADLSFTAAVGEQRITFIVDPATPRRSYFAAARIPTVVREAAEIWAGRLPARPSEYPLLDLLNEVYAGRLASADGTRMDRLAEDLLTRQTTRDYLLRTAAWFYRTTSVGGPATDSASTAAVISGPSSHAARWLACLVLTVVLGIGLLGYLSWRDERDRRKRHALFHGTDWG